MENHDILIDLLITLLVCLTQDIFIIQNQGHSLQ